MIKRCVLFLLVVFIVLNFVSATDYFSYQMNFPPGEARYHLQDINYSGSSLVVTVPTGFNLINYTSGGSVSGSNLSWGSGTNKNVEYTLQSPSNCQEGDIYYSEIYVSGSYVDKFVFVCVPDREIVNYKAEYGHGDSNYLDYDFISNESTTLFNLIRVFNIGHYLEGDNTAYNANISCSFERYPIRTFGRVDIEYFDDRISGDFFWDEISSGYWFRIGVLSQEISGKSIGDLYEVNCTELTYDFEHERVKARFEDKDIEIRSSLPLQITTSSNIDGLTYSIKNIEKYPLKGLVFKWKVGDRIKSVELNQLQPNEEVEYRLYLSGAGFVYLDADFIPSWYANSLKPRVYTQSSQDAFNGDASPLALIDVEQLLLEIQESQENNFRVEISDFVEIVPTNEYRIKVWIYDNEGKPINPDVVPRVDIYDSSRTVAYSNIALSEISTGIFEYNITIPNGSVTGVWESIVNVTVGGVSVYPSDYWKLKASPTKVEIVSILDNVVENITADVIIQNEGDAGYEYPYEYCIVINQENQCGGDDDVDYASAAKYLNSGEVWNPQLTLDVPVPGVYYFKVCAYWDGEKSCATKKFTAISPELPSPPGGGGGTVRTNLEIIEYPAKINVYQGDLEYATIRVKNVGGKHLENVELRIEGQIPGSWYEIMPAELDELYPGDEGVYIIKLKIPLDARPENYPLTLIAKSAEGYTDEAQVILDISPRIKVPEIEVVNVAASSSFLYKDQEGKVTIFLHNPLNEEASITSILQIPSGWWIKERSVTKIINARSAEVIEFEIIPRETGIFILNWTGVYGAESFGQEIYVNVIELGRTEILMPPSAVTYGYGNWPWWLILSLITLILALILWILLILNKRRRTVIITTRPRKPRFFLLR
jgi:hypothetical protein